MFSLWKLPNDVLLFISTVLYVWTTYNTAQFSCFLVTVSCKTLSQHLMLLLLENLFDILYDPLVLASRLIKLLPISAFIWKLGQGFSFQGESLKIGLVKSKKERYSDRQVSVEMTCIKTVAHAATRNFIN